MTYIGPIFITGILGFIASFSFYLAIKPYEHESTDDFNVLSYSLFFQLILSLCKRIMPQNLYMITFRLIVFGLGLSFVWGIIWFWQLL